LFGVVLDNSEKCSEWYWTTLKNVWSYPIPLRTNFISHHYFFGVVLDNSKKYSEWYWTTPKIVQIGIGQLQKMFGLVMDNSEKCSELSNTTPKIFSDLSNITSLADPHCFYSDPDGSASVFIRIRIQIRMDPH